MFATTIRPGSSRRTGWSGAEGGLTAGGFGSGFAGVRLRGSQRNDRIADAEGRTFTNNDGGIAGGITNGNDIVVRVAVKPTPSIALPQQTFDFGRGCVAPLRITGRHDACIALRAGAAVEAMVAFALADLSLRGR